MPNQSQSATLPGKSGEEISMNNVEDPNIAASSRMKRWIPIFIILTILAGGYLAGLNEYFSLDFITENRDKLMMRVEDNYLLSLATYLGHRC